MMAIAILYGCVEEYQPEIDEGKSVLVVNGAITDLPGPYMVRISTSSNTSDPKYHPLRNCVVTIADNLGNKAALSETSDGEYYTDSAAIRGIPGRRYHIIVETPDGERFESDEELLMKGTGIKNLYPILETHDDPEFPTPREGYQFYIDTEVPVSDTNYYMWSLASTHKFDVEFKIYWYYDGIRLHQVLHTDSLQTCFRTDAIKKIFLYNTSEFSQPVVEHHPLHFEDNYSKALTIRYSLYVQQMSLTKEAYTYWNSIREIYDNQGSLYEYQPYSVRGNIYKVGDRGTEAYGYFMAAGASDRRVFVDRPPGVRFIYDICLFTEADIRAVAYLDYTSPDEWPVFVAHDHSGTSGIPNKDCMDCRENGVLEKPPFWID